VGTERLHLRYAREYERDRTEYSKPEGAGARCRSSSRQRSPNHYWSGIGKTEVVAQRVVDLLADGATAESILAFTFTERAAEELKNRIAHRVEDRLGREALDRLTSLFVGTIHAYCFRLLQQRVPRYETYDVLDDNRLTAFVSREAARLEVRQLDDKTRLFASIDAFLKGVEVVENGASRPADDRGSIRLRSSGLLRDA
jgi:superfamily I DNA/RNA helicase